jgi:hypothetical protein
VEGIGDDPSYVHQGFYDGMSCDIRFVVQPELGGFYPEAVKHEDHKTGNTCAVGALSPDLQSPGFEEALVRKFAEWVDEIFKARDGAQKPAREISGRVNPNTVGNHRIAESAALVIVKNVREKGNTFIIAVCPPGDRKGECTDLLEFLELRGDEGSRETKRRQSRKGKKHRRRNVDRSSHPYAPPCRKQGGTLAGPEGKDKISEEASPQSIFRGTGAGFSLLMDSGLPARNSLIAPSIERRRRARVTSS